jgi:hypothetical protein
MIRALANKKIDLSDDEFRYLQDIKKTVGESEFLGLFSTNKHGIIQSITPSGSTQTSIVAIFFLLNVMMNQRLRRLDDKMAGIDNLERRLSAIEASLAKKELR